MAEGTITFEITLSSDLVEALDKARGKQSRDEWLGELLEKRFPRQIEEQEPKVEYLPFGEGENKTYKEAFNKKNAAIYLKRTDRGFQQVLDSLEEQGKPVQLYKQGFGKDILILKETLDDLMIARPIEK